MKTQRTLEILLAGIVLMLVNACATYPRSGQAALAGTWTNSLGTVWTCRADDTFHVDPATRHNRGTFTTATDTVNTDAAHSTTAKGRNGPDVHDFSRCAGHTQAST